MIYVLARDLNEALQWALFHGLERIDWTYLGSSRSTEGLRFTEVDRIVHCAMAVEHPSSFEIVDAIERSLVKSKMTETLYGSLVRQEV